MKLRSPRHWLLLIIVIIGLALRLYKINNPVLDWHSFRQADTASVTREYVKHGINILVPRYHDLSNIQSGQLNLEGYRMVEFPIVNAVVAGLVLTVPWLEVDLTSRIVSVLFSLGTIVSLFFVTKKYSGAKVAYMTALMIAILPFSVYYSRVILPEPAMLFFFVFALLAYLNWLEGKKLYWYGAALLSLSLALLLKPFVVFFTPVLLAMTWAEYGFNYKKAWPVLPLIAVSGMPLMWWREWIQQFPSGIPATNQLFNDFSGMPIRFRPAWFRVLGYERLIKLISGFALFIFFPISLWKISKKEVVIYGVWWLGVLAYFSVFAAGSVRHDYYQVIMIPIVAITLGRGIIMAEQLLKKYLPGHFSAVVVGGIVLAGLLVSGWQVKGYYNINHYEYLEAGAAVDRLLPADAKVIAHAMGDTLFLYQTNRTGWPIGFSIDEKIEAGAEYYVTTAMDDEAKELEQKYFTVEKTPTYLILDLTQRKDQS